MARKALRMTAFLLLALACAVGAVWTAIWSLRFGLTPWPPLSPGVERLEARSEGKGIQLRA